MHVRHIEQEQPIAQILQQEQKPEDEPPLAEIVESLALLAAIHAGHHQPIPTPKEIKRREEEEEPDGPKPDDPRQEN